MAQAGEKRPAKERGNVKRVQRDVSPVTFDNEYNLRGQLPEGWKELKGELADAVKSIACLTCENPQIHGERCSRGTAFLLKGEGINRYLITCAHVWREIAKRDPEALFAPSPANESRPFKVEFAAAPGWPASKDDGLLGNDDPSPVRVKYNQDIVILRLVDPAEAPQGLELAQHGRAAELGERVAKPDRAAEPGESVAELCQTAEETCFVVPGHFGEMVNLRSAQYRRLQLVGG